jgi:hypothetical protein
MGFVPHINYKNINLSVVQKKLGPLYNQKICIKYMVRTQLYIFTQNSTHNYMFRPCILAIIRLYYKLNKQLYNMYVGYIIRKYVLNIWSEHYYIFSHRIVHTTTCFGPVYWPLSDCIINLISSYTVVPHTHIV